MPTKLKLLLQYLEGEKTVEWNSNCTACVSGRVTFTTAMDAGWLGAWEVREISMD